MKKRLLTTLMAMATMASVAADDALWQRFVSPSDEARTKVWWFHGETETKEEGIDADLEAFKEKGVGGVVFYDQVHGDAAGAFPSMSPEWWRMLKYAARKARQLGLKFEVAASNGYVSGGPWITQDLGMRKTAMVDTVVTVAERRSVTLRLAYPGKGFSDIATVMFPDRESLKDICIEPRRLTAEDNRQLTISYDAGRTLSIAAISYATNPRGKGSTGSMNIPGRPRERYFGAGFVDLPPIGDLEYSVDGKTWERAAQLPAVENVIGHKSKERTVSFPSVSGRYFRVRLHDWMDSEGKLNKLQIENVRLSARDRIDNWQVKAGLRTEVYYPHEEGGNTGAVDPATVSDVLGLVGPDGTLTLTLEPGTWHIMRFGHVPTGGRTKHGRKNLLGLEASVMSAEAARVHYDHYFGAICDTLSAIGCKPDGMAMDSHEAGIQNWAEGFEKRFSRINGYDITTWLPALAGYIVGDRGKTERMLLDFRKAIASTISSEFYSTFARLCHEDGVNFTSQAMLNIDADNISCRGRVDKPQGEFWAYQANGNYDCLDAASAAHLYGHAIASAEAFTDSPYRSTWDELLRIANLAYCKGTNEFVVCASSYQPWLDRKYDDDNSKHPYIFHRLNPNWATSGKFWNYQARCSQLLREGRPVVDLCIYLGEDLPLKTMAYKLPVVPEGYNFDVCTYDALMHRFSVASQDTAQGRLAVSGGMRYKALVIQDRTFVSAEAQRKIEQLERGGVPVIWCNRGETVAEGLRRHGIGPDLALRSADKPADKVCFYHRQADGADIYFVYNHSSNDYDAPVTLRTKFGTAEIWNPYTVERKKASMTEGKTVQLHLEPYQSAFIVAR